MKIFYAKGSHIKIYFGFSEFPQALKVLKALATFFKADFIQQVADDLEQDLQPKLPFLVHHCEKCCMEIKDGEQDTHYQGGYVHKICPPLKNRG